MNSPLLSSLEDVQNTPDERQIAIDQVGIKSLRYPVFFQSEATGRTRLIADFSMYVCLPHHVKGTHMSRFIALLERPGQIFSLTSMKGFMQEMLDLLEAKEGHVEMRFPFFMVKKAPVSGVSSLMDYDVTLNANMNDRFGLTVKVEIPVTSLCPCSKKISDYGAHNQRSLVTVEVEIDERMSLENLIKKIEQQASSELYGLLKRPDEKYVTERAYDNPKFVEDLVRDIAVSLAQESAIGGFRVECENFESIHNHSAYAMIDRF